MFLLPFGGVSRGASRNSPPPAGDCDIILIDGPAVGTAALERFEFDHRVDGVIAWLPESIGASDDALDLLDRRFGSALMGIVRQAA